MPATVTVWKSDEGRARILPLLRAAAKNGRLGAGAWDRIRGAGTPSYSTIVRSFGNRPWAEILELAGLLPDKPGPRTSAPKHFINGEDVKLCECSTPGRLREGVNRVKFAIGAKGTGTGNLWLCDSCREKWREDEE